MPLLPRRTVGSRLYWGEQQFVDAQIRLLETGIQSGLAKRLGSGTFGVGWAVGPYLIKKTHDHQKPYEDAFVAEADTANILQNQIPDFVTTIKGARYGSGDTNDYIIFDLLQGYTLDKYLFILNEQYTTHLITVEELYTNLSYLFHAMKISIKQMNALGYSHCDLKPDNMFFNVQQENRKYKWSTAVCWLIDFGFAIKGVIQNPGTYLYSATRIRTQKHSDLEQWCGLPITTLNGLFTDIYKRVGIDKKKSEINILSQNYGKYNSFSQEMIWLANMAKLVNTAFGPGKLPKSLQELGFPSENDYLTHRKGLINNLRNLRLLPVPPPRQQVDQQAAQRQAALNAQQAAQKAAQQQAAQRQAALNAQKAAQQQAAQQQAAQKAAQQQAQQAPEPYFTKITTVRNGIMYKQVTDGKDTWWEDPQEKSMWVLPDEKSGSGANVGIIAAQAAAAAIAERQRKFNAMFKKTGGSRTHTRRRQRQRQSQRQRQRQSRQSRII